MESIVELYALQQLNQSIDSSGDEGMMETVRDYLKALECQKRQRALDIS